MSDKAEMKNAASANGGYQLQVNGVSYPISASADRSLLSVLRNDVGLTGTKEGCDDCECGACIVLVDGQPVNSCSYLAAQAQGTDVETVEGLAADSGVGSPSLHPLQKLLLEAGGVQCGFCTPGMLMSAKALIDRNPEPSEEDVRIGLSGNLCRCTGYDTIVAAVLESAAQAKANEH